jgi:betaine lipid synthase
LTHVNRCHPPYLTAKAHAKLSRPGAFEGLRIHTDEINEVTSRIAKGTLTIAIVMDSMDWFDPKSEEAPTQISALNRALKLGGRVMLRSAGLKPWYIPVFESNGFTARRVGARLPGSCIDRYDFNAHVPSFTLANDYPGLTCMPVRGS